MQIETGPIAVFQEQTVPAGTRLAGWAALVRAFGIAAPARRPSCVSDQHVRGSQRQEEDWTVYDKRYWPGDTFADHLGFALRHEDLDLLIFKRVCDAAPADAFADMIRAAPTGNLLATLQELEHLGVGFVSLTEALDLTTPAGRAMAGLLAIFAEFEREILRERTRAGLAHARENGKRLGRPATAVIHAAEIRKLHRAGISKSEIARRLQIGRTSVRRVLAAKQ